MPEFSQREFFKQVARAFQSGVHSESNVSRSEGHQRREMDDAARSVGHVICTWQYTQNRTNTAAQCSVDATLPLPVARIVDQISNWHTCEYSAI
ncbi:MAG TPA: hypothetical protein DCF63_01680, partial [Planctomycetaceae bacterium]|nr:hypothetical protein [Planctomycetaceae bacterium]